MNNEKRRHEGGSNEDMKKPRVTVDFTQKAVKELEEISLELGSSKADVIRRALVLLKIVIDQKKIGYDLFLRNEEKQTEREVFIVWIGRKSKRKGGTNEIH